MIELIKKILKAKDAQNVVATKKAQIWANPSKMGLEVTFELDGQEYVLRREFGYFVLVEGKEWPYSRCTVCGGRFKETMRYYRFH